MAEGEVPTSLLNTEAEKSKAELNGGLSLFDISRRLLFSQPRGQHLLPQSSIHPSGWQKERIPLPASCSQAGQPRTALLRSPLLFPKNRSTDTSLCSCKLLKGFPVSDLLRKCAEQT